MVTAQPQIVPPRETNETCGHVGDQVEAAQAVCPDLMAASDKKEAYKANLSTDLKTKHGCVL